MIARIWRGRVRAADAPAYREYVVETGLAGYKATPGNRGAYLLTRIEDGVAHIATLSLWDSYEAIAQFAGDDIAKARYYPRDAQFLLDFPEYVEHYEVD